MNKSAVVGSKVVIALVLAGSVVLELVIAPVLAAEVVHEFPEAAHLRWPGILGVAAVTACAQAALVAMWRLLTLASQDRVFDPAAFRLVNLVIGCAATAAALMAAALVVLAAARALPPGAMLILLAGVVVAAGLALLLVVMRGLLRQACGMRQDLAQVI